MIEEIIKHLYLSAISLSGYMPAEMPVDVVFIERQTLIMQVCAGKPCPAVGYYDKENQKIYFDNRYSALEDKYAQGFLVHEIVHYLQDKNDQIPQDMSCDDRINLEKEAYQIQALFLVQHGLDPHQVRLAITLLSQVCR